MCLEMEQCWTKRFLRNESVIRRGQAPLTICRGIRCEIEMCQMLLNSLMADFMPVYSLMRSKTPLATAFCCDVAECVALITLGHRRKHPSIPVHFCAPENLSEILSSWSISPRDRGTVDSTSFTRARIIIIDACSSELKSIWDAPQPLEHEPCSRSTHSKRCSCRRIREVRW